MSAYFPPNVLTLKAGAAIAKGCVVKPGADRDHVLVSAAATSKNLGIAQNAALAAEDLVEVAVDGGGAKGLCGDTVAFGDLLTADSVGKLVATTTPGDRYVAKAMEDGVVGDLIAVMVCSGLI